MRAGETAHIVVKKERIYRRQICGLTQGSTLEEQWRMFPFEMGYKKKLCVCVRVVFLMWGPGGQCPDSTGKIRPTCDEFTSQRPTHLRNSCQLNDQCFLCGVLKPKNVGLLAPTWLLLCLAFIFGWRIHLVSVKVSPYLSFVLLLPSLAAYLPTPPDSRARHCNFKASRVYLSIKRMMVGAKSDIVSFDLDLQGGWTSCHIWPWLRVLSGWLGNGADKPCGPRGPSCCPMSQG